MSRRGMLKAAAVVAAALALAGAGESAEPGPYYVYLPQVETLAAWGWARWDAFTWG